MSKYYLKNVNYVKILQLWRWYIFSYLSSILMMSGYHKVSMTSQKFDWCHKVWNLNRNNDNNDNNIIIIMKMNEIVYNTKK